MQKYYLAVDIGASSGRHILGTIRDNKIELQEIYRFENGLIKKNGNLCWDLERLFREIKNGLKECKRLNKVPISIGIDTWGVDFVLLNKENEILGDTVAYRDHRTNGTDQLIESKLSFEEIYQRTGIQKQLFNTANQLTAILRDTPDKIEQAEDFLMIPDYFNYLLTGVKRSEYTNATTTQLVDAVSKEWDYDLIEKLGLKKEMFKSLSLPKTTVGIFTKEIEEEVGFSCEVVLPATHDTGSAVLSVPAKEEDFLYISSGTWSLMGIESKTPNCSQMSMEHNFTNEGGFDYRFRYLKNIMGLWMIQSVRQELNNQYSFGQLCDMAKEVHSFPSRLDVNDPCFLSPENMSEEIKNYCIKTNQKEPSSLGKMAFLIYQSLAKSYADTVKEIETITGKSYSRIHIVGGGSKADYLNELTAMTTGKEVYAGPVEATALGNITAQMLKAGEFHTLEEARSCIFHSFEVKKVLV